MAKITFMACMALMLPGIALADSTYFRGTRTGWGLTEQAFVEGRYKEHNLFIVIGAKPTTATLHTISEWKSKTTYLQDLREGVDTFGEQLSKSATSIPDNCSDAGKSIVDLFVDPVTEISNVSLITPAAVVWKTAVNIIKVGWNSAMVIAEPVARVAYGTVALAGSPLIKPATYSGIALIYSGTALYGYGSSVTAGTVMAAATGTVLALDVASVPAVAVYEAFHPASADGSETERDTNDDDEEGTEADEEPIGQDL